MSGGRETAGVKIVFGSVSCLTLLKQHDKEA
jgi:hypothetical protein